MASQLIPWMQQAGIWYDESYLAILGDTPGAMSVRARADVPTGTRLAKIPKSSCLTKSTTRIAEILAKEDFSGGLGLVIAVWYERGLGARSDWHGYFQSTLVWHSREAPGLVD